MSEEPIIPGPVVTSDPGKSTRLDDLATYTFWTWNMIFLAFVLGGFVPSLLVDLVRSVRAGWTPFVYLVYLAVLTAIPIAAVTLGLTALRKRPPRLLFGLGYVVEGPLMMMLMFRFFAIRQGTPVMTVIMLTAVLGMGAFLWHLLRNRPIQGKTGGWLLLAGLSLLAGIAVYVAVIVLFYVPPLAVALGRFLIELPPHVVDFFRYFEWQNLGQAIAWLVFSLFGLLLAIFSATLIIGLPLAVPWLSLKGWSQRFQEFRQKYGPALALTAFLPLVAAVVAIGVTMRQPQRQVYDWLKTPPATVEQAQALLSDSEQIRSGLLNAYLASYRYFSAEGEVNHIRRFYEDALKLNAGNAYPVQRAFEWLLRPLLYQPLQAPDLAISSSAATFASDQEQAGKLYKQFFDTDIIKAEREEMVRAARATYNGQQAEADWMAVDDREILLKRQEVTVTEHGDWAEVELYEVYHNQTRRQQEVVYYFSLPESAVVTSLYLGKSANRDQRYPYRVAPRGAAQAVYRNEIRIRMDPALIEQIGPRQYRLRIFPVEPIWFEMTTEMRSMEITNGPPMHMWLTYRTMAVNNAWPLPVLTERRNIYWDAHSQRLINGQPASAAADEWLPASVPASAPASPAEHRVTFPGGQTVIVRPQTAAAQPALPAGARLALVLDRSRSMNDSAGQVRAALNSLKQQFGERAEVYLTASSYRGEAPSRVALASLDPDTVLYYGGQNAADLLRQFEDLQGDARYDAVLVLTDGSGYEVGESAVKLDTPNAPVWVVHLGGKFPLGYDDPTLDAINASGGGVAGSVEEALQRLAASLDPAARADVLDGYTWQLETGVAPAGAQNDGFAALAARRLILTELRSRPGQEASLATLDRMQALAKENSIVTPYSSMIVLVEERQKTLLDQMEKAKDRFDREVEQVGETAPLGMIAGVPEPHEWLLIGLAVLLLGYMWWSRKQGVRVKA